MIDKNELQNIDTDGMFKIYDSWPEIAANSYHSNLSKIDFDRAEHFVFAGMGGSGAIGDVFASILSKTDAHVSVVKGYHLPNSVSSKSIIVITSVSGNTDEAISILEDSIKTDAKIIVFSSGGQIEKKCKEYNVEFRKIQEFHSPRASFTVYLFSMLAVLKPLLSIKDSDIIESIENLRELRNKISSENISKDNPSVILADWIKKTPVIYYPDGLKAVAIRFKNSLQENAKIHVIAEDLIEACHNGIVSWEKNKEFQPILIEGKDDFIKTKKMWLIFKEFFEKNDIKFQEVFSVNGSILSKIICLIYLLDYSTIYLAINLKRNPTPVESIDFIKRKISNEKKIENINK